MWKYVALLLVFPVFLVSVTPIQAQNLDNRVYSLGVGDRLRVIVFGEDNLSGEFEIGSQGSINLPLIGDVLAEGGTIDELEDRVEARLAEGYLINPRVSIEVMNYRPFYILGEVNVPGSYTYVNGMTVLNAVAMAGGFTYRADEDDIQLSRPGSETALEVRLDTPLLPGDIIRVEERFF
ncbi:MAG: polysaccharide export protein [Pseudomonadales bacterium]|nr:polysaccharide export protein [Pseudomonadales bacterium]